MSKDLARQSSKGRKSLKFIFITLTLIILLSTIGFIVYKNIYLPKITKDYVDLIQPKFSKTAENVSLVEKNIDVVFYSKEKDSFSDLSSAINTGNLQSEELIKNSNDLNSLLTKNKSNLENLNRETRVYSNLCNKFAEEYKELTQYYIDISKESSELTEILEKIPSISTSKDTDITQSLEAYKAKEESLIKVEEDIISIKTNSDTKEYNDLTLNLISKYKDFFNKNIKSLENLQAVKTKIANALSVKDSQGLKLYYKEQRDILDSFSKYKKELEQDVSPYNTKTDEYASKTGKAYLEKIDLLKNQEGKVRKELEEINNE